MKKLLAIILIMVTVCSGFSGCGDDKKSGSGTTATPGNDVSGSTTLLTETPDGDAVTPDSSATAAPAETEKPAENVQKDFVLFSEKAYSCKFLVSASMSDADKAVSEKLAGWLKDKTGKKVEFISDTSSLESDESVVLIGKTAHATSTDMYKTLSSRKGMIKVEGRFLVIAFDTQESGTKVVEQMINEFKSCDPENIVVGKNWKSEYREPATRDDVPAYSKGKRKKDTSGENTNLTYASATTLAEFNDYCDTVAAEGFTKVYARDTDDLSCMAFTCEDVYVYAYYAKRTKIARILVGPKGDLSVDDFSSGKKESVTPSLTLIGQSATMDCGQGYIFVLPDGRLIVQDGGYRTDDKVDYVYNAIKEVAPDKNNIVIAAWFVSHPHCDHTYGMEEFLDLHKGDKTITVERVIYNFVEAERYEYKRTDGGYEDGKIVAESLFKKINESIPNAKLIKAHTGQVFKFGSANIEIMYTVEDYLPSKKFDYVNTTSTVIRVNIAGQSVMLLADTTHSTCKIIEATYAESLKSDMVQLAHHGLYAGSSSLYQYINAKVLLWPNTEKLAKEWVDDAAVVAALAPAKDVYISGSVNTTLTLPYTIVNNKDSVITALKSGS